MMEKSIINDLIDEHDLVNLEKHITFSYILASGLDYSNSQILTKYFREFIFDDEVFTKINKLKIDSLKKLESYLELLIPNKDRKLNGAFFTPQYIVSYIIDEIKPAENDKNIDPSCGAGAFLIGIAEYYKKTFNKSIKQTIKENIYGADILDYNVRRSKIILSIFALENDEIVEENDFNIFCQDSLKIGFKMKFNNVLGNPPYVKFQDLADEYRQYLSTNWVTIKKGTYNLYFAFFELGYKLLKRNGKLGYITPNNYFTSLSGESLRNFLQEKRCIYKIIDFNSKKVFDAQTYTAITILTKTKNDAISFDRISDETPKQFLVNIKDSIINLNDLNSKKWRLLKEQDQTNIRNIEKIGQPIGEIFDISVGIATLKDEVYFIDEKNTDGKFYFKKTSEGVFEIEKNITKTIYKISDFKSQEEVAQNTRRIIFPYKFNDSKKLVPIPEIEFEKSFPKCYKYLLSQKEVLKKRDGQKADFNPFYIWGRSQGLNNFGVKILTPTFSQYPRFLINTDASSFFTNGYAISFKTENEITFPLSKIENLDVIVKILNSIVMHYYISSTSVSISGGFPCYQKNFIENFNFPNLNLVEIQELRNFNSKEDIDNYLINKYQLNIPCPNLCS